MTTNNKTAHTPEELRAAKSHFVQNGGAWFSVSGKPSINREDVFGREEFYEGH